MYLIADQINPWRLYSTLRENPYDNTPICSSECKSTKISVRVLVKPIKKMLGHIPTVLVLGKHKDSIYFAYRL